MKIYTKTGDKGETSLFSGKRVSKDSSYIKAYGTVDELNAWLGFCISSCSDQAITKNLQDIQKDLHGLCADLATPLDHSKKIERLSEEKATQLETLIDPYEKELTPLKQFILAGGSELASRLHIARTVCRRAERKIIAHAQKEKINPAIIIYLNRLSDFLFVLARLANKRAGTKETLWTSSSV